jgi:DNA-directed RNA polymerase subunit M/transcription elongation factor TFIIS
MQFCPIDGSLLLYELAEVGLRFCCQTCPYVYVLPDKMKFAMKLKTKAVRVFLSLAHNLLHAAM